MSAAVSSTGRPAAASPPSAPTTAPCCTPSSTGADDAPVTLVLAHGWTLAQAAWDDVAELLTPRVAAGELRLIRYDQRGHGRSTWGRYAGDVAELSIDQLGADLGDADRPAGPHRARRPGRALDGRHDDHVPGRGPARAVRRPRPRRGPRVDVRRRPRPSRATPLTERLQLKLAPGMVTVAIGARPGARADAAAAAADAPAPPEDGPRAALRRRRHRRDGRRRGGDHARLDGAGVRRLLSGARRARQAQRAQGADRRARRDPGRRQRQADAEAAQPRSWPRRCPTRRCRSWSGPGTCSSRSGRGWSADAIERLLRRRPPDRPTAAPAMTASARPSPAACGGRRTTGAPSWCRSAWSCCPPRRCRS